MVVVEAKFAQRFWPDGDPIGKHLWFDPKRPFAIVGVVGVVKQYGLETDGKIAVYFPQQQQPDPRMFLAVRTSSEPTGLSSAVVGQIHAVDPEVAVYEIRRCKIGCMIRWHASAFRVPCLERSRSSRCCSLP